MTAATKLTAEKRDRFLRVLAETGNVTEACRQTPVSRQSAYSLRDRDGRFRKAWEEAVETAVDALEAEARRRAYEGVREPVFYQGHECGHIRKYSDTLLIFLLKGHRPEKYRERYEHTGPDGGPHKIVVTFDLDSGDDKP